ncbi:ependymin isoform X1 [Ictalurus punctatus]|uniref:Ependymin isoform X1 n=2 Tax=Ictalurus TaxID=7997 RepID=A0A2D0QBU1_ICTPU|nr:ependymin isoform X1 [Ictalurus punctatus]
MHLDLRKIRRIAKMRTIELFCVAFLCLSPMAWVSSSREPCRSPAKTKGLLSVTSAKDDTTVWGDFKYDAAKKYLRFVEDSKSNRTSHLDVLVHFEQDVIYEFDSKNDSCKKQSLPSHSHPLEVPADATHQDELYLGSLDKSEQGLRVRIWSGNISDHLDTHHSQAHYSIITTSCGCVPVSCIYHSEKYDLIFKFFNVEIDFDEIQAFKLPDYCDGVALEEASDDHSFFDLFHD